MVILPSEVIIEGQFLNEFGAYYSVIVRYTGYRN